MKYHKTILSFSLIIFASSCTVEKMVNYKAQIHGNLIFKDTLFELKYYNQRIDVGNELEFSLDFTPKSKCSLVIKSLKATAALMKKDKKSVKRLLFQNLEGHQYNSNTYSYIYNSEKKYSKMSFGAFDTYTCFDTLSNINNTYRYEFRFNDKYLIREKLINFNITIDFQNLTNDSAFTMNYRLSFKRKKSISLGVNHGR
jgi:hypothetical protein